MYLLGKRLKKHIYKIRPCYGSKNLLIEFETESSDEIMLADIHSVFATRNITSKSTKDFIFRLIKIFDSACGQFEMDIDVEGFVFILADKNQAAIPYLGKILSESGMFQKKEVNFDDYNLPND